MPPVSAETLVQNLNWRYATKKFDPARKIAEGTWRALEQSLVLSPSSFGLQLWKFIVVQDASLRAKLRAGRLESVTGDQCFAPRRLLSQDQSKRRRH